MSDASACLGELRILTAAATPRKGRARRMGECRSTNVPTPNAKPRRKIYSGSRWDWRQNRRANPAKLLRAHQTQEFGANLVEAAFVGFTFLMKDSSDFGGSFQARLGMLLDLNVHHFFQLIQISNRLHGRNRARRGPVLCEKSGTSHRTRRPATAKATARPGTNVRISHPGSRKI